MQLYHCTTAPKIASILQNGLKVNAPFKRENKPTGIYLSTVPFRWMLWATDRDVDVITEKDCEKIPLGAQVKVDVSGLYVIPDDAFGYEKDKDKIEPDKDFICMQDIPKERIIEVLIEKRNKPTEFGGFEPMETEK